MEENLSSGEKIIDILPKDAQLTDHGPDEDRTHVVNSRSSSETDQLLDDGKSNIRVTKTWRHLLIGPVVYLYFFGMVSAFFVLVEYTNKYWRDEEYKTANLSQPGIYSSCNLNVSDRVSRTEVKATSKSSEWVIYYTLAAGIPAVFSNFILGAYMDSLGRKRILVTSIIGTSLRLVIQGLVIYFSADLMFFLIACLVEGCTGQHATCFAVALAYTADITHSGKSRAIGMAVIEGVVGIAIASASLATGYMVEQLGFQIAVLIDIGVLGGAFVTTIFFLPETFKDQTNRKTSWWQLLKMVCQFFIRNDEKNSRWKYQVVIISLVLTNIALLSRTATETLYQLAQPFCWTPRKIGIYVAVRTICMMLIGFGSLKLWQKCLDEVSLVMLGNLSFAATYYWTAFLSDDLFYYLVILVGLFGPLSTVMQRTILSHLTPANKQGAIFTSVGVLEMVGSLVGNVATSAIYAETVSIMRGLVFLVLGGYNTVSLLLMM